MCVVPDVHFLDLCVCGFVCYLSTGQLVLKTCITVGGKRGRLKRRQGGKDGGSRKCRKKELGAGVGGGGGRVSAPGGRCCQGNSQRCSLLRTKQNYLGEQKSANTCLGGSF